MEKKQKPIKLSVAFFNPHMLHTCRRFGPEELAETFSEEYKPLYLEVLRYRLFILGAALHYEDVREANLPDIESGESDTKTPAPLDDMLMVGLQLHLERMKSTPQPHLSEVRSCFHSTRAPHISISDYVARFVEFCPYGSACFVMAFIYIDRIGQQLKGIPFNDLTSHKLLSTSIILGIKFVEDEVFDDDYFAAVAGVSVKEFLDLQSSFLELLDWKLSVNPEDFERYQSFLLCAGLCPFEAP